MTHRRTFLTLFAATGVASALTLTAPVPARAQAPDKATAFVKATGDKLVGIINGPGTAAEKRAALTKAIDAAVDVNVVGRFCLGRYWNVASAEQQKQYLELFHAVLVTNISAKLGEYTGVHFTLGKSRMQDEDAASSTIVERPNNPPTNVDWIISNPSTNPKIVDVIAEGTSLRLTQRSDYASYLSHNSGNIDSLIAAMRQQVSQSS
jgi:phospholipid transport system substrate-binding protein